MRLKEGTDGYGSVQQTFLEVLGASHHEAFAIYICDRGVTHNSLRYFLTTRGHLTIIYIGHENRQS